MKLQQRKKKLLHSTAVYFLIALFGTLFLHAAPLFIFKPYHAEKKELQNDRRFTVMISNPELYDIEYWSENSRPDLFAKPDPELGYTAIAGTAADPFLERTIPDPEKLSLTKLPEKDAANVWKNRSLPDVFYTIRMPFLQISGKKETEDKIPFYAYSGKLLLKLEPDGAVNPGENPQKPVRIRIAQNPDPELPPLVSLADSCGVPRLDRLALQSVRKKAVSMNPDELQRFSTVFIDWKAAPKEKMKK